MNEDLTLKELKKRIEDINDSFYVYLNNSDQSFFVGMRKNGANFSIVDCVSYKIKRTDAIDLDNTIYLTTTELTYLVKLINQYAKTEYDKRDVEEFDTNKFLITVGPWLVQRKNDVLTVVNNDYYLINMDHNFSVKQINKYNWFTQKQVDYLLLRFGPNTCQTFSVKKDLLDYFGIK